jgi:hypothetical protein
MVVAMAGGRVGILAALLLAAPALAGADEPPVKLESDASAKAATEAEAKAETASAEPFKPPPGFRTKKRGEMTLYCRREAVLGSRFQAEKCYDEEGVRQIKLAELEQTEMLERIKACATGSCSSN